MFEDPLERIILLVVLLVVFSFVLGFLRYLKKRSQFRKERAQEAVHRGAHIWSISGANTRQNSAEMSSWPTHQGHVSIDSFVITVDRLHADKGAAGAAPPLYQDLDLPTYEQATAQVGADRRPEPEASSSTCPSSSRRNDAQARTS